MFCHPVLFVIFKISNYPPMKMLFFHTHWNDHLELSTHTNCQKLMLSHILCLLFSDFQWDELKHLKHGFEIIPFEDAISYTC